MHWWQSVQNSIQEVVHETSNRAGRLFDEVLLASIVTSVFVVMLDSVASIKAEHGEILQWLEWGFTLLFTIEYILRLIAADKPIRYAGSFFGIVDLLSILPTYMAFFFPGTQYLMIVRVLRVLRIFRILKLAKHIAEAEQLVDALKASQRKIQVFLATVITMVTILGSLMYVIEGEGSGFTSIPRSIYWAIVTLTTVGYGDVAPTTPLGQALASVVMILGYALIIVPTGIVTAELTHSPSPNPKILNPCDHCGERMHEVQAEFCNHCGRPL